jgi:hypothetical protein
MTTIDTATGLQKPIQSTEGSLHVKITDGGGGGGGSSGSVTAAGTNGTLAQAVQGITGGVPIPTTSTDTTASGSITTSGTVAIASAGKGTVAFTVTGTWVGTIVIEIFDGTNWNATSYVALASGNTANSFTANTSGQINCVGYAQTRLRGATLSSGTANVHFTASEKVATVMLDNPLPAGSNNIGNINNITGTVTLPTGAATAANQSTIITNTGRIPAAGVNTRAASMPTVSADAKIIDCSFTQSGPGLIAPEATKIGVTGSGMAIAQSYGNLTVDTGTTANAEFLMRSVESIKGGHIARIKTILSQRIVNQHFAIYLADLIGSGVPFTTDATGLLISVTLPSGHGFTSANIGQSCYLGGCQGAATIVPGRYAITAVSGNAVTFSPVFFCTWTRTTTTASATFLGGNPIFSIGETAMVSASSDITAIVNGSVSLVSIASGGITNFTCLNAGAISGTLTMTMSSKAWTPSASGTITVFGWNAISAVKNGLSATAALFDSQRKGWASGVSLVSTTTDANPGVLVQFSGDTTSEYFSSTTPVSGNFIQFSQSGSRMESLVDADTPLYLFIQVFNGVTAPASTTRLTIGKFSLEETGINKVIIGGVSQTGSGNAMRVNIDAGTTAVTVAATGINVAPVAPVTPLIINSAASTNGQLVLTGSSGLHALFATNTGATVAFVKLYNKATAPTVGTDVPAMIVTVPAAVAGVPGEKEITPGFSGYRFALGLGLAITGAAADSDTTAVAAGQVKVILSRTV